MVGGVVEVDDVCELVRKVYGNQVHFVDGDEELVPGLSVHKIGGHSAGLMCVRVWTQRGWVVVASDCAHFYENFKESDFAVTDLSHSRAIIEINQLKNEWVSLDVNLPFGS